MNDWLQNFEEIPDEIAVVDLETANTIKNPTIDSKIVQIGITVCNLKNQTKKIVFNELINDDLTEAYRSSWIFTESKVHLKPLSFDDVIKNGKNIHEFWDIIQTYLDLPITAYNSSFDLSILRFMGFDIPQPLPCLMYAYGESITPKEKELPIIIRKFQLCYKKMMNKSLEDGHDAGQDAYHEAEVFFKLLDLDKNSYPNILLHCDLVNIFRHDISNQIRFYHQLLERFLIGDLDEKETKRWEQVLISDVYTLHVDNFSGSFGSEFVGDTSEEIKPKIHQMYWEELSKRYNLSIKVLSGYLLSFMRTRKSRQYTGLCDEQLEQIINNWNKFVPKF